MKRIIMDLDDTVSITHNGDYENSTPIASVVDKLREYSNQGFEIVFHSSRNMRTHSGNIGKINIYTLPNIIRWLDLHEIPYDEVYVGKPWCGFEGFYVDDKAIRPAEFVELSYDEIINLIGEKE